MDFPNALKMVFAGHRLARTSMPGNPRFIFLETVEIVSPDDNSERLECQVHRNDGDQGSTPFTPSQHDLFALDWELLR